MSSFHKWAENGRGKWRNEAPRTKDGKEVVMWHMMQSFSEKVSPVVANEIGRELAAEVFGNFAVTISTHTNTEHIHNHFIISAWDMDGRKWHDCHVTKRKIREVSDRLCAEYGLSVLDKTKNTNLVKYTDKAGTVRYYEPTDRKAELIQQRGQQKTVLDDVGSYRYSSNYQNQQKAVLSNQARIRHDIDLLLPSVGSYEELFANLRDAGYRIRDKKENGSPLAHVTFQTPLQEKGTRDSTLGDIYCREQLVSRIATQSRQTAAPEKLYAVVSPDMAVHVPYFEKYEYGSTALAKIPDTYRAVKTDDGKIQVVERQQRSGKFFLIFAFRTTR